MAPQPRFKQMLAASRDEAQLAVRLYNDPAEARSFEGFVVHTHLAWLYPPACRVHPRPDRLPVLADSRQGAAG